MKSDYNETFNPQARMKEMEIAIEKALDVYDEECNQVGKKFDINIGTINFTLKIGSDKESQ